MGCIEIFLILVLIGLVITYWPVALILFVIYIFYKIIRYEQWKVNKYHNVNFDIMDGHQFEYFCAEVLKDNGFTFVEVTQKSGDHGVDILANKGGVRYAIQCKCYSKNVGNKAVQEAYSGKDIYKANIAVVLTNRYFTEQAKRDAQKLKVELWDRTKLLYFIRHAKREGAETKEERTKAEKRVQGIESNVLYRARTNTKVIDEEKLLEQRESFDKIIEKQKNKKEEKLVYDKERGIYPSGEYVVGEDIQTGRYLFKSRDKKSSGSIQIYSSYYEYLEHNYLSSEYFDGDYFATIRQDGQFIVVKNADFQKMEN